MDERRVREIFRGEVRHLAAQGTKIAIGLSVFWLAVYFGSALLQG